MFGEHLDPVEQGVADASPDAVETDIILCELQPTRCCWHAVKAGARTRGC